MVWVAVVVCGLLGAAVGWCSPELSQLTTSIELTARRPLYAVGGAVCAAATAWSIGWHTLLLAWMIIVLAGIILSAIDLEHHRLPDRLVLPLYPVVALALLVPAFQTGTFSFYIRGLIAMVIMFAIYFALALIYPAGMGMGDVKFSGVLGLALGYLGGDYVFVGFIGAFLLASVISIGLMVAGKLGRKSAIAFGPFMLLGAISALVVGAVI